MIKVVRETVKNEAKKQKVGILGVILGNLLTGKGPIATSQGWSTITPGKIKFRAGEGVFRAGQDF